MRVHEKHVTEVVTQVSAGAADPQHVSSTIGTFMQRQPMIGHYVQAHTREIGLEGAVLTLLHASVVARCVELAVGRRLRPLKSADLDRAARAPESGEAQLAKEEPELVGYLVGNLPVDDATLGGKRRPVALQLLRVITRALLDQP